MGIFLGGSATIATSSLIIGVGAFELSHGNILGIHAIAEGAAVWGVGVYIGSKGYKQIIEGWNEEEDPCEDSRAKGSRSFSDIFNPNLWTNPNVWIPGM